MEQQKALDFASLQTMAEQVEGSFSFTVMDSKDNLSFVKGDNPLYILHFPAQRFYLYASTQEILERALRQLPMSTKNGEQVKLECGELLCIDATGQMIRDKFNTDKLYRYSYFYGYYPSAFTNSGNDEYVDSLKSVAYAYGYTPEVIDRMLAYGFCPEEIEDFLCCGEV